MMHTALLAFGVIVAAFVVVAIVRFIAGLAVAALFLLAVLFASMCACSSVRATYYSLDDIPCGWCASIDTQPGPVWHPSQQFAVCKRDRAHGCEEYTPELLGSTPGQMFSNLAGPLGSVADKIMVPVTPAP